MKKLYLAVVALLCAVSGVDGMQTKTKEEIVKKYPQFAQHFKKFKNESVFEHVASSITIGNVNVTIEKEFFKNNTDLPYVVFTNTITCKTYLLMGTKEFEHLSETSNLDENIANNNDLKDIQDSLGRHKNMYRLDYVDSHYNKLGHAFNVLTSKKVIIPTTIALSCLAATYWYWSRS